LLITAASFEPTHRNDRPAVVDLDPTSVNHGPSVDQRPLIRTVYKSTTSSSSPTSLARRIAVALEARFV
jgi:hypothetical protein